MVFGVSVLNRVYNFKPVCPGPVLDRGMVARLSSCIWQSEIRDVSQCIYFSEQCFTSIEFPLKVHRC